MPIRVQSKSHPDIQIYWGFDKFENEELLKYALDGDIWFHVDKHSSAHIYVRLLQKYTIETMPPELIAEAAQITKENSIEGCKLNNLTIIYTPYQNILKDGSMDVGTVSFHNDKAVRRTIVKEKDKEFLKYVKHNKVEDTKSNLMQDKLDYEKEQRRQQRALAKQMERQ